MKIETVYGLHFSPTDNTRAAVCRVGEALARALEVPFREIPWTLPGHRAEERSFSTADLVVVGGPPYAGKLPNKILPAEPSPLDRNIFSFYRRYCYHVKPSLIFLSVTIVVSLAEQLQCDLLTELFPVS